MTDRQTDSMKQTLDFNSFRDAFTAHNRADHFPGQSLEALFDYLEEYESSTGEELELDVVALCCDYTHYDTALEAATDYGYLPFGTAPADLEENALEWLQNGTHVILNDNGIIVANH